MAQYIDKSALVTEIERQISAIDNYPKLTDTLNIQIAVLEGNKVVLTKLLSFLNTLEVKEVDLEKEFYDFLDTLIGKDNGHLSEDELFRIAEYFFELGLKAQRRE